MVNFWKEFNEINLAPESNIITSNNYIRIENLSYKNNQNSTLIETYTLDGGGHEWFNLDIENKNTSEIIWDFFSKHNLNNLN
jgi:poly(3-hydroxybutyrate) depolymerase